MSESPTQNNNNNKPSIHEKSIPEHIIDGTIVIDSIEAFTSILKQFPEHPALLKKLREADSPGELLQLLCSSQHSTQH